MSLIMNLVNFITTFLIEIKKDLVFLFFHNMNFAFN